MATAINRSLRLIRRNNFTIDVLQFAKRSHRKAKRNITNQKSELVKTYYFVDMMFRYGFVDKALKRQKFSLQTVASPIWRNQFLKVKWKKDIFLWKIFIQIFIDTFQRSFQFDHYKFHHYKVNPLRIVLSIVIKYQLKSHSESSQYLKF